VSGSHKPQYLMVWEERGEDLRRKRAANAPRPTTNNPAKAKNRALVGKRRELTTLTGAWGVGWEAASRDGGGGGGGVELDSRKGKLGDWSGGGGAGGTRVGGVVMSIVMPSIY